MFANLLTKWIVYLVCLWFIKFCRHYNKMIQNMTKGDFCLLPFYAMTKIGGNYTHTKTSTKTKGLCQTDIRRTVNIASFTYKTQKKKKMKKIWTNDGWDEELQRNATYLENRINERLELIQVASALELYFSTYTLSNGTRLTLPPEKCAHIAIYFVHTFQWIWCNCWHWIGAKCRAVWSVFFFCSKSSFSE